jgi:hypothetical protein
MAQTKVLPEIEEEVTEFDGMAHYVRIKLLLAGRAVVALCGKKYVPRDIAGANEYPICPKCAELYELLKMMNPEG